MPFYFYHEIPCLDAIKVLDKINFTSKLNEVRIRLHLIIFQYNKSHSIRCSKWRNIKLF